MKVTHVVPPHEAPVWSVGKPYPSPEGDPRTYTITAMDHDPDGTWWVVRFSLKATPDDGIVYYMDMHIQGNGTRIHHEIRRGFDLRSL